MRQNRPSHPKHSAEETMARQQQLTLLEDSRFEQLPEATQAEVLELLVQLIISATSAIAGRQPDEQDHQ
jgi:hypothetical protein